MDQINAGSTHLRDFLFLIAVQAIVIVGGCGVLNWRWAI